MSVSDTAIEGNRALVGAGIHNGTNAGKAAVFTLSNSTVSGNVGRNASGGINNNGDFTATNVTISANQAGTCGGINNFVDPTAPPPRFVLTNSTVADNVATSVAQRAQGSGAGVCNQPGGILTLKGDIIAGSVGGVNCSGSIISSGFNLSSDSTCALLGPGDRTNVDPKLGRLADNGGPTLTHALLQDSPAINAGGQGCSDSDQRGTARPQGPACDMGAYEVVSEVATGSPPTILPPSTGDGGLLPAPSGSLPIGLLSMALLLLSGTSLVQVASRWRMVNLSSWQ